MSFFRKKEKNKIWKRNPKIYSGAPKRDIQGEKTRFSRFLFWVLFLSFLGVCVYILLFSPFLEIETVAVEGNKAIPTEDIVEKVNEAMAGKYFNYFSKRNFFLASKKEINQKLKNDFNRLEISSIEKKFPKALLIKVQERQPELVWCSGGVCYLVDKNGFIYAGANATDEELNQSRFLVIIDESARPIEIKKSVIDSDFILYIKEIDARLVDDLGLSLEGDYHTPALSSREIFVKIKEGEGAWTLKLSSTVSPEDTKKILQTVFEKELTAEKRKNLDYLDLRIKGKVYYRLNNSAVSN
jgi:cell division septal protein FtsQ